MSEQRPAVIRFANAMEETLRKHDSVKGGWQGCTPVSLFEHLKDEVIEAQTALDWCDAQALMDECVDIANMAMMVWGNLHRETNDRSGTQ